MEITNSKQPNIRRIIHTAVYAILLVLTGKNILFYGPHILREQSIRQGDFPAYYSAGNLVKTTPKLLYNSATQYQSYQSIGGIRTSEYYTIHEIEVPADAKPYYLPFRGLPVLAILFALLTRVGLYDAYLIASGVHIGLLLATAYMLAKLTTYKYKLLLLAVFAYEITWLSIAIGQFTVLMLWLCTLIYYTLKKENYTLAGILTAGLLFKTQYIVIAPLIWVSAKLNMRFAKSFLTGVGVLLAASMLISGNNFLLGYIRFVGETQEGQFWHLISGQAYLATIFQSSMFSAPVLIISGVGYLLLVLKLYLLSKTAMLEYLFSLALVAGIVFTTHAYRYDKIILFVALVLLTKTNIPRPIWWALTALTCVETTILTTACYFVVLVALLHYPNLPRKSNI